MRPALLCALLLVAACLPAQTTPAAAPEKAPDNAQPAQQPAQQPAFSKPPIAIVPLDRSLPGAALEVSGAMQAWNGRAYLTGSGSIVAGAQTASVTLPDRGVLQVCASSTVKLAADSGAPTGEVPGLLIALDRGAVEMSLAASKAREKNADTLLTPYFRILIGGPNPADVKVRLGDRGDTCVDNIGADAPYVVVTSVFEGGLYRVQPGQRVMFEHGSLQSVVDQEKEPCGCPPPAASRGNEFPLAQSEGMAPSAQAPVVTAPPMSGANATASLAYSGADRATRVAAPVKAAPAAPVARAVPAPPKPQPKTKKSGFFSRVGRFFRKIFGAD